MIVETITFCDSECMEVYAKYVRWITPSYHAEPGNPNTFVAETEEIELKKMLVDFGKETVNILPLLNKQQKEEVINLIKQKTEYE